MSKKQWIICGNCVYYYKCQAGQLKMIGIDANSPLYNDIGCYDHEQASPKQIKLF
jgi:hypothetical protein